MRSKMTHPFFSIGHSTRSIAEFVEILRESAIELVVVARCCGHELIRNLIGTSSPYHYLSSFDYEHVMELGRVLAVGKFDSNCSIPSDGQPDKRSPF